MVSYTAILYYPDGHYMKVAGDILLPEFSPTIIGYLLTKDVVIDGVSRGMAKGVTIECLPTSGGIADEIIHLWNKKEEIVARDELAGLWKVTVHYGRGMEKSVYYVAVVRW